MVYWVRLSRRGSGALPGWILSNRHGPRKTGRTRINRVEDGWGRNGRDLKIFGAENACSLLKENLLFVFKVLESNRLLFLDRVASNSINSNGSKRPGLSQVWALESATNAGAFIVI
jgi:hypothetical protein